MFLWVPMVLNRGQAPTFIAGRCCISPSTLLNGLNVVQPNTEKTKNLFEKKKLFCTVKNPKATDVDTDIFFSILDPFNFQHSPVNCFILFYFFIV